MDEARAMLDQLMGKTRDLPDAVRKNVRQVTFTDKDVCKYYICGLCPYLLFSGTKSDIGKCPSRHCGDIDADTCKKQWEELPQEKKNKYGRIQRNKQRSEIDTPLTQDDLKKLLVLQKQIDASAEACEAAADADDMDRCFEIKRELDQLREAACSIMNPNNIKHIDVCEVSGNFMSSRDNDERMRAHFEGKQYLAWKRVRAMHTELSTRLCDVLRGKERERYQSRSRSRSRSREHKFCNRRHSASRDRPSSTETFTMSPSSPSPSIRTSRHSPVAVVKVPMLVSSELEEGEEIE